MSDAFPRAFRVFLLLVAGALAVTAARELLDALSGPGVPALWWSARALGLVAYVALALSTLFGVLVSARGAGGLLDKATTVALHNRWALAALVATALHVLAIVVDPEAGVSPLAAVVPLASTRLTGPVALGTLAGLGMAVIAITTALSRRLPRWMWRATHASAFGVLLLSLVHGLTAGTDTRAPGVQALYLVTAAAIVGAVVQRVLLAKTGAPARGARGVKR
ncbi:MAG: hypothetical protein EP329_21720 [Deltaproteobacteria bacterium]|nr:MAG: hypothetical protein EP329_21720 [Deltaproteobacteria bacterium]